MAFVENKLKAFFLLLVCSIPFWGYVFFTWQGTFKNILEIKGKVNVLVHLQNVFMDSRVFQKPKIKQMIRPCQYRSYERLMGQCHNTSWENRNMDMTRRTKADLTEIEIELPTSPDQSGRVILQTFDELEQRKMIGGDFWRSYISNEKFKKALYFVDHFNGSYSAEFLIPFKGTYTLNVFLEHSVCDGIIDPPLWWFTKGMNLFLRSSKQETIEVIINTGRLFFPPLLCVANPMFCRPYCTNQIAVRLLGSQSINQNAALQPMNQQERGTLYGIRSDPIRPLSFSRRKRIKTLAGIEKSYIQCLLLRQCKRITVSTGLHSTKRVIIPILAQPMDTASSIVYANYSAK